jgi:hypothetical protein
MFAAAGVSGRTALPLAIVVVCAALYVGTLGPRAAGTSDNAHFVHLANSFLHGQLSLVSERPPGDNDWSHYAGRWYVSFPPFPALLIASPLRCSTWCCAACARPAAASAACARTWP